jgi:putative peptidoglycan lipid II flippase
VTGQAVPVTDDGHDSGRDRPAGPGVGRAAATIAALTVLARLLGLIRTAPGLAGYGLVASMSLVLLAAGPTELAATAIAGGWLVVIVADVVLVALAPGRLVVPMLAAGNSLGLTVAGVALALAVRRVRAGRALAGLGRVAVSGLAAAAVGAAVARARRTALR